MKVNGHDSSALPGNERKTLGKSQRACPVHPNRSEADDKKPPKENPELPLAVLLRDNHERYRSQLDNYFFDWKEHR